MAEGMYPKDTLGDTAKPMDWKFTLTQAIPLWGRQDTAGRVSSTEAKIARFKLDAAVRDVALQVRQSAAELRYLDEAVQIVQGQQLWLETDGRWRSGLHRRPRQPLRGHEGAGAIRPARLRRPAAR